MPDFDKEYLMSYGLQSLLPDHLAERGTQGDIIPGHLGFILGSPEPSYKEELFVTQEPRFYEATKCIGDTRITLQTPDVAEEFDFAEPESVTIGGNQTQLEYREVPALKGAIYGVDMNQARATTILPKNIGGGIGTKALAGCTGILGCAELPDGSVFAYVSHFDPLVDAMNRSGGDPRYTISGDSPSEAALTTFLYDARQKGAERIRVVATYDANAVHHPHYGRTSERGYYDWHFLDQIQNTLRQADEGVQWVEKPYEAGSDLSLVVEHTAQGNVITFGGETVDFKTISTDS